MKRMFLPLSYHSFPLLKTAKRLRVPEKGPEGAVFRRSAYPCAEVSRVRVSPPQEIFVSFVSKGAVQKGVS